MFDASLPPEIVALRARYLSLPPMERRAFDRWVKDNVDADDGDGIDENTALAMIQGRLTELGV